MRKHLCAVVAVASLIACVLGASEIGPPRPSHRGWTVPWRDGAKILRVQECGKHYAIVTLDLSRVVDTVRVTDRGPHGEWLGERTAILLADEYGHATMKEKPTRAWWEKALEINREPAPQLAPPHLPTAEDPR
ncbi:MAG: hypothetical protein WBX15_17790 [Thermoanaerobaculia bacterium]